MNLTLPASFYTSHEVFLRELERHFVRGWVAVGRAEDLAEPASYFTREIAGESVIVTRDAAGAPAAFYNVCRHRGTRMCAEERGKFRGSIQCPYHGWTYGLDGALIGAPHMGNEFQKEDWPLHRVPLVEWHGCLFANLSGDSAPPELPGHFTAWHVEELARRERFVYDVRANWKLIVANYNECLHCPLVHPALNRLTDYLGADNDPGTSGYFGGAMGFRNGAETMSLDGVRRRAYLPGLDAEQRQSVEYWTLLPNMLLSLHPDYAMIHTLWPKAVDRTDVVCEFLFHPDERGEIQDATEFWDRTNREDWRMCELSQLGISSRAYTPGPYSPREELLARFDHIVAGRVVD